MQPLRQSILDMEAIMSVADIYEKRATFSFEVFPPKTDVGMEKLCGKDGVLDKLYTLEPDYISCTYGAGGTNVGKNLEVLDKIQKDGKCTPVTHFTCIGNTKEDIKDKLTCKVDLEAHFTEKVIGNMGVDVLDIGTVHFPTGQIFACDPLVELEDTLPFLQTIPAGTYPVKICVVPSEQYGDRYACVKVEVSQEKPVRYELGMTGNEELDAALGDDDYFGFGVDAGMGCIADIQTQAAFKTYWAKRLEEDPDIDPYNDHK